MFSSLAQQNYISPIWRENITNLWVKLTLENQLVRGGCPRAYKHMAKLILNPYGTLGS